MRTDKKAGPAMTLFVILVFITAMAASQDISSVKNNKPLTFGGNFTARQGYMVFGDGVTENNPWNYFLSGNVNLNFYGLVDVPLSGTYTKQEKRVDCPEYKEYGISPCYKSLTVHGGYRTLALSGFTLSGTTFLGGAIEYKPNRKWYEFTVLYGRFKKPEDYENVAMEDIDREYLNIHPFFDRRGYAGKIALKGKKNRVELILFRAFDLTKTENLPPGLNIGPADNLCISFTSKSNILKNLNWSNELALSALNENILVNTEASNNGVFANSFFPGFAKYPATGFKKVFVSDLKIRMKKQTVGLGFRHIDPGYKTLGIPYVSNDLESYTLNIARAFFKNKVNFSGNTGIQRNNLDKLLESTGMKYISGANISWNISKGKSAALGYSNYSSNLVPARIEMTDSIRYFQVNENYSVSFNSSSENETQKSAFSFFTSFQKATAARDGAQNETGIFSMSLSQVKSFKKSGFNLNAMISGNKMDNDQSQSFTCIPSLTAGKILFKKKLNCSVTFSDVISILRESETACLYNIRAGFTYQLIKSSALGADFSKSFKTGNSPFRNITQFNVYLKISF